ncbi:penicillin-binding protein 2 [Kytococcus sp. HMSC28H12]|uniref:peptidoglycan D,D-transpeptidase FtsI family protein n=1 Tax=Kytococcus sp. HMSC28H12 TaxID=1581067 RepID=UPI000AFD72F0|nr:penicillin-binding transpeptidase domain-containing protein [Kytococcus sp. HMSC28H12]
MQILRTARRRTVIMGVLVLVALLVLGGRMAQMQVVQHDRYATAAQTTNTRSIVHPAVRGRILAADGTPFVRNVAHSTVTIDPQVMREQEDKGRGIVEAVATELGQDPDTLWGRTRTCGAKDAPRPPRCNSGGAYQPITMAQGVDPVKLLPLLERPEDYPGVKVDATAERGWPKPKGALAAQTLGYLTRVSAEDLKGRDDLQSTAMIGRDGLEAFYDGDLRGRNGVTKVAVSPAGRFLEEISHTEPQAGLDVRTHLVPEVQRVAEEALAQASQAAARKNGATQPGDKGSAKTGAALVMDVETGGVVASASLPGYNPEVWKGGVDSQQLEQLVDEDGGVPLTNKLVSSVFPPASTFKAVSLPTAFSQGLDAKEKYSCPARVKIGDRYFRNFESKEHGDLTLQQIIEVSCDTAFYRWSFRTWRGLGGLNAKDVADPYVEMARGFGLGSRTGIDLPHESAGRIPDREWKLAYWESLKEGYCKRAETGYTKKEVPDAQKRKELKESAQEFCLRGYQYRGGDAVNFSIGQGDVSTTPLQMAVVYAAIANGGNVIEPRLAKEAVDVDGKVAKTYDTTVRQRVGFTEESLRVLREGLEGVMTRGTASWAFKDWDNARHPLAGKTGTAEVANQAPTSWFVSYDAGQKSKYVVLVVLGDSGTGSEYAAPVARSIWNTMKTQGLLEANGADAPVSSADTKADIEAATKRAEEAKARTVTVKDVTKESLVGPVDTEFQDGGAPADAPTENPSASAAPEAAVGRTRQ